MREAWIASLMVVPGRVVSVLWMRPWRLLTGRLNRVVWMGGMLDDAGFGSGGVPSGCGYVSVRLEAGS